MWTPARRLPITRGSKVRPIDDLSEFKVNAGFGTNGKVILKSIDGVIAVARAWKSGIQVEWIRELGYMIFSPTYLEESGISSRLTGSSL